MRSVEKEFVAQEAANAPAILGAERFVLAVEVLRSSGRLRLQVRGASMLPALWPHDEVEITACFIEDLRPGEIVLAQRDGRFFLHRFVAHCDPSGFLLQGDSMPTPDPQFPNDALLGRLSGRASRFSLGRSSTRPECSHTDPMLPLSSWSWAVGRILCYCGFARRVALRRHAMLHPAQSSGHVPYDVQNSNPASLARSAGPGVA